MSLERKTLTYGFLKSVEAVGEKPAVDVRGDSLTYKQLFRKASSVAATLSRIQKESEPPLTAIFAYRSVTAYAGVLAALLRGHGYVPLNRTFPTERTRAMLVRSGCREMIVDTESERQLGEILEKVESEMLIILPEREDVGGLTSRWPKHRFIGSGELASFEDWRPVECSPDAIAYLLFTSGSTGAPKGVMVTHRNVRHYIEFITKRFAITSEDRFSQTFDMTFDLSVADMFVAWESGACVCCPSERMLINPGRFINDACLTIWFSVPSTAVFMKRLGALKAGAYPNLRVSMFCGEALPVEVAKAWAEAAPNSLVENLYGPTELTIACMYYRWDSAQSLSEAAQGIVPIGEPFPDMLPLVVDQSLKEVAPGEDGELIMAGPQLSLGYWHDSAKTATAFVRLPGRTEVFYRTGDRVRKPIGVGPILYLGRIDNQIKVLGYRVELGEVEAVVRKESGIDGIVAIGWPKTFGGAGGVEVFLEAESSGRLDLKERVDRRLPSYMAPRRYHFLPRFPLNANGKYDRGALASYLEGLT